MVGTFAWHVQYDTFYSDARFAEMFSVDPAKGDEGAPLSDYLAGIHPDDFSGLQKHNRPIANREKYVQEYRLLQKDGKSAGSRPEASVCTARTVNRIASSAW